MPLPFFVCNASSFFVFSRIGLSRKLPLIRSEQLSRLTSLFTICRKKSKTNKKNTKKKTDKIVYLILLSLLQPGEFLCRTDGISNINSIKWNSIFHMCNCVCFIECIWNIPILIVIIIHHEFL